MDGVQGLVDAKRTSSVPFQSVFMKASSSSGSAPSGYREGDRGCPADKWAGSSIGRSSQVLVASSFAFSSSSNGPNKCSSMS